jgi:DNA-directed RNA polymerase subunit F
MKFKIPRQPGYKRMVTVKNDYVMPILFNDTDLNRMFALLFERCVKKGVVNPPRTKKDFADDGELNLESSLIPKLSKNPKMQGFDNPDGNEILLHWIRTSIIEFTTEGKTGKGEQVDYMRFLNIAGYRSGLPKSENRSSTRNIDTTIFRSLVSYVKSLPDCEKPLQEIHEKVTRTSLAQGVDFEPAKQPWEKPVFNEVDHIDINTLLQLRLLEHFEVKAIRAAKPGNTNSQDLDIDSLPFNKPLVDLAKDFFHITCSFAEVSAPELLSMYKSIFVLRLYRLPILLAMNLQAVSDGIELQEDSHQMFFDFTRSKNSSAYKLANESVLTDISRSSSIIRHFTTLNEARNMVLKNKSREAELLKKSPDEQVAYLYEFSKSEVASDKASEVVEEMRKIHEEAGPEGEESLEAIRELESENGFEHLINLILLDVQKGGLDGVRKWLSTVGGLRETVSANSVAILAGESRAVSTWHYSMSDSVLNTLMYLCFLNENGSIIDRQEIALSDVLGKLRVRYGILINEPPAGFDSPEHHAAADENFTAFKSRIKQLGWFAGLSDDFDAQYISRPSGDKK